MVLDQSSSELELLSESSPDDTTLDSPRRKFAKLVSAFLGIALLAGGSTLAARYTREAPAITSADLGTGQHSEPQALYDEGFYPFLEKFVKGTGKKNYEKMYYATKKPDSPALTPIATEKKVTWVQEDPVGFIKELDNIQYGGKDEIAFFCDSGLRSPSVGLSCYHYRTWLG
jgi:hypothetical protein